MQSTFGVNTVALVNGVPRTLSLLELLTHYLEFQREIVTRRSKHELRQLEKRTHILEGYLIALDNLDAVIALIRAAADTEAAKNGLMETFELSELQALAILELRLRALTALERKGVEDEYRDKKERIAELRLLLSDESKIDTLIKDELLELQTIYARHDDRRTEIVAAEEELELEDLIAEEDMVIAITRSGYIKRLPVTAYREQRRGGIGVMGMDLKDEDYIEHLFVASTHDYILFFTSVGKVYRLKVHELPLGSRQSKGRAIVNLLPFRQGETVRAVIQTRNFEEAKYLLFATKNGVVKKTELGAYNTNLKADGIIAIKMREGDELVGVRHSSGEDDVLMVSRLGQAIRFSEQRRARDGTRRIGRAGNAPPRRGRGDLGRDRGGRLRPARRDRERVRQAHPRLRVPEEGPRRDGREDRAVDGRARSSGRRACRARRLPGDADLDRRHRDQDARRGRQAARPLDAGRDRDAAARGRARLVARTGRRVGRRRARRRRAPSPPAPERLRRPPLDPPCDLLRRCFPFARGGGKSSNEGSRPSGQRKPSRMTAYSKQVDLLEPIDMAEHLDKIELYLGQVCAIAGISKMQLDYWTNKAQIPTKGKKQRIYDMDAVETVMLIKQAKDKGLNLGAAIDAARRFRAAEDLARLGAKSRPPRPRARRSRRTRRLPSSSPASLVVRGKTSRCQCGPSWSHAFSGTSCFAADALKPPYQLGEQA